MKRAPMAGKSMMMMDSLKWLQLNDTIWYDVIDSPWLCRKLRLHFELKRPNCGDSQQMHEWMTTAEENIGHNLWKRHHDTIDAMLYCRLYIIMNYYYEYSRTQSLQLHQKQSQFSVSMIGSPNRTELRVDDEVTHRAWCKHMHRMWQIFQLPRFCSGSELGPHENTQHPPQIKVHLRADLSAGVVRRILWDSSLMRTLWFSYQSTI